jgi:hypothetical protein
MSSFTLDFESEEGGVLLVMPWDDVGVLDIRNCCTLTGDGGCSCVEESEFCEDPGEGCPEMSGGFSSCEGTLEHASCW